MMAFFSLIFYTGTLLAGKKRRFRGLQAIGVGENANRLYTGIFAAHPGKKNLF